jgi:hypothetical protein
VQGVKQKSPLLGKMLLTKKAHEKISSPRAGFNSSHLADSGKMAQEESKS